MAAGYGRLLHIRPPVVSTGPAIQMASAGVVPGQARMYARTNGSRRMALTSQEPRDDDLMRRVAAGSADALGGLHARFARLIFAIAVRSLDRSSRWCRARHRNSAPTLRASRGNRPPR